MSRATTVDLDDADDVLRVWAEANRILVHRAIDPELRGAISQRAGDLGAPLTSAIRAELDQATPAVVLEARWRELIYDRPAVGAFRSAA